MNKIIIPEPLASRITVKNVKDGFGHDLMGLFADIYLDKKKVGHYNDDGWGGEVDLHLLTHARKIIEDKLVECNYAQQLFDNGWAFMESPEKITISIQVEQGIYAFINAVLVAKAIKDTQKRLQKDILKGICIGTDTKYTLHTFKIKKKLPDIVHHFGARAVKESIIKNILPYMKEGERILNTNLKELGIDLDN